MLRLCTVHGRYIELKSGKPYILGRGADCDIVIEDRASSRRHARIQIATAVDVASIVDLKSRNGTYVNDQLIVGTTPLHGNDRIRIGATVYLVTREDADEEDAPAIDTKTQALENLALGQQMNHEILRVARNDGHAASEFAGRLGAVSVLDLMQMLVQTKRNGTVHLALEAGEATIEIRDGDIVSAFFDELTGVPALQMLVKQRTGLFWLVESSAECTRTIREATTHILIELGCELSSAEQD